MSKENNYGRGKRGQVTLFVIIGLALILIIGFTLYITTQVQEDVVEEEREKREGNTPTQFQGAEEIVKSCIYDVGLKALKIMGSHGGYIKPRDRSYSEKSFSIDLLNPTGSDGLTATPSSPDTFIPYYLYLDGPNDCSNCKISSNAPTEDLMKRQLNKYLEENIGDCLDFSGINDYDVEESSDVEASTILTDSSVIFYLNKTLTFRKDDTVKKANLFVKEIGIPLRKYYRVATSLASSELSQQYLENLAKYLISSYSGLGRKLPPISAFSEKKSTQVWSEMIVEQHMKNLLTSFVPVLKVENSKNEHREISSDNEYEKNFYDLANLDIANVTNITDSDLSNLTVDFLYSGQPIYLSINPSEGGVLKPSVDKTEGILVIPPRQRNYYRFFYDLSYPSRVVIRDEEALPDTDYTFTFGLEANLRENKNMIEWLSGRGTIPWDYSLVKTSMKDLPPKLEEQRSKNLYSYNKTAKSLFCDQNQRRSDKVKVKVFDRSNNPLTPLEGASVYYGCGKFDTCSIGRTELDNTGHFALVNEKFPLCKGGYIKVDKEGYHPTYRSFTTYDVNAENQPDFFYLDTIEEKNLTVQVYDKTDNGLSGPRPLKESERALVTLNRMAEYEMSEPVPSSAIFDGSSDNYTGNVRMTPGSYEVNIMLLDKKGIHIPKKCKKVVVGEDWKGDKDYKWIPEEPIDIKPAPMGGVEFSEKTFLWRYSPVSHSSEDIINLYVVKPQKPPCLDGLDELSKRKQNTRQYRKKVTPDFGDKLEESKS